MANDPGPSSLASAPNYAGTWNTLKPALHATLHDHLTATLGFTHMTPVQASVIPLFLSHKDVIVEAVTGSGKTLAYALPVLQMIINRQERLKKSQLGALVICPTRELAIQVHGIFQAFIQTQSTAATEQDSEDIERSQRVHIAGALLAVGGSTSSPADDYKTFKEQGSDIIVGTPGRVEELLKRPNVNVKELDVLILDEADRLLDMGFNQTLTSILQMLPKQRRTGLFSATMTDALSELARVGLRNPVRVVVKVESKRLATSAESSEKRTPATLENFYSVVAPQNKLAQLHRILRCEANRPSDEHAMRKAIVYFATCAQVNYFYKTLSNLKQFRGLKLYSLHGKQTPARRRATFEAFVSSAPIGGAGAAEEVNGDADVDDVKERSSILLCTDVAARGLDLPNVDLVVQFDAPTDPKVFSHRCGRTARAGRRGRAVILLHEGREADYVDFLKVRKNPVRAYHFSAPEEESEAKDQELLSKRAHELHDAVRCEIRSDRALYEASMQAFVSFVQCYRKHEVSFVFRERDLPLDAVAFAFGLLRLPRMPEVERWRKSLADDNLLLNEESVDLRSFAYADKLREQQRLTLVSSHKQDAQRRKTAEDADLAEVKVHDNEAKSKRSKSKAALVEEAWSEQKARKERKQLRRDKKQRKRAFLIRQKDETKAQNDSMVNDDKGKHSDASDDDNDEDWAQEEREAKKARKEQPQADVMFDDL